MREGAPDEINLPSKLKREIERNLNAATADGRPPPAELFVRAEQVGPTTHACHPACGYASCVSRAPGVAS